MAKQKPTTVETPAERTVTGNVTNPREIEFPFDQHGFTTLLRKEGVRAVGRIKGDREKLSVFISTLKVLGEYSKAKLEAQEAEKAQMLQAVENRAAADAVRDLADTEAEVSRLAQLLESAKASLAAKKEKPSSD